MVAKNSPKDMKQCWNKIFKSYVWNANFQRCSVCAAKNCPHRNSMQIDGGDFVCRIEHKEFMNYRKLFTRDYKLTPSDLAQLDLMLYSIIRLKRMQRYCSEIEQETDTPIFNHKTGETFYIKEMKELQKHMEKVERGIREWLHSMKFARKERNIKKGKQDIALALSDTEK